MLGGFMRGVIGWVLMLVAFFVFVAMLIGGGSFGISAIVAGIIAVFGAYLGYASRHTMRTR